MSIVHQNYHIAYNDTACLQFFMKTNKVSPQIAFIQILIFYVYWHYYETGYLRSIPNKFEWCNLYLSITVIIDQ